MVEPLKISCSDSDCDAELHCFRPKRVSDPYDHPVCRECGADLVDWEIVHRRDPGEVETLFAELPKELIRHHYWHMDIPEPILEKARRFRPAVLAERTKAAIQSHVAHPSSQIYHDGTQTANEHSPNAQIYFLGMHAVAACCRKCMEYWHGIPREQELTEEDEFYFASLVWLYVCRRLNHPEWIAVLEVRDDHSD
jgi:hypothetical protein